MKALLSKPCRICGNPVQRKVREDKKGYYYPLQCPECRHKPRNPEAWHKNMSRARMGKRNWRYKENGSRIIVSTGSKPTHYVLIKIDGNWKAEHRYVMENHIGRKLKSFELIHHKDENPLNNAIENLEIIDRRTHPKIHFTGKPLSKEHCENIKRNHWRHKLPNPPL